MRVRPTLGMGRQGWERLMGGSALGLPSQRLGKQEEKVAKPPAGGGKEVHQAGWPAGQMRPGHSICCLLRRTQWTSPAGWPSTCFLLAGHSYHTGHVLMPTAAGACAHIPPLANWGWPH